MSRLASGRDSNDRQRRAPPCFWHVFETELGWMAAVWKHRELLRLTFGQPNPQIAADRIMVSDKMVLHETMVMRSARLKLKRFSSGEKVSLRGIKLGSQGRTPFQRRVLAECRAIPWGSVVSYGELANQADSPRAARAVGAVMRSNRHPLIVPCHRVIAANGRLGGYSAHDGLATKRVLLQREGIVISR